MTTKEQKEQAGRRHSHRELPLFNPDRNFHPQLIDNAEESFIAGAEWAESQMRWIPGLPKDCATYLFRLEYFSKIPVERTLIIEIMTGYIDEKGELYYTNEEWSGWDAEDVITYYMPLDYLPAPPAKEDGKNDGKTI